MAGMTSSSIARQPVVVDDVDLAISLSCRISIDLYQEVRAIAVDNGVSVSEAVRWCLGVGSRELEGAVIEQRSPQDLSEHAAS